MRDADEALIVIDVQNDFCPGGALAVAHGDEIIPLINEILPYFPVKVFTQDWHPAGHSSFASSHDGKDPYQTTELPYGTQVLWPDHCIQGSIGAKFHDHLHRDRAFEKGSGPRSTAIPPSLKTTGPHRRG